MQGGRDIYLFVFQEGEDGRVIGECRELCLPGTARRESADCAWCCAVLAVCVEYCSCLHAALE